MTPPRELTPEEFQACFAAPMADITGQAVAVVDIWPYIDALDLPHLGDVQNVYEDAKGRFHQVLIGTGRPGALLVLVIDLAAQDVLGHFVLDLAKEYGVSGEPA